MSHRSKVASGSGEAGELWARMELCSSSRSSSGRESMDISTEHMPAMDQPSRDGDLHDIGLFELRDDDGSDVVTLRRWLNRPGRIVDRVESLHIFKQVVELVELAHCQGVILRNIRPSCFVLSPLNRVDFIDLESSSSSSDKSSEQSIGRASTQAISAEEQPGVSRDLHQVRFHTSVSQSGQRNHENQQEVHTALIHGGRDGSHLRTGLVRPEARAFPEGFGRGLGLQRIEARAFPEGFGRGFGLQHIGSTITSQGEGNTSRSMGREGCLPSGLAWSDNKRGASLQRLPRPEFLPESRRIDSTWKETDQNVEDSFPLRHMLTVEQNWYTSPEELTKGTSHLASDIYSLGMLFFELFSTFASSIEWSRTMSDMRHRILPPSLLSERPKEAALCLWLLHPEPQSRPKAREILQCELLNEVSDDLAERQAAVDIEEQESECVLLLEFLKKMQREKEATVLRLNQGIGCLTVDILEIEKRRESLQQGKERHEQSSVAENEDGSTSHRDMTIESPLNSKETGKRYRENSKNQELSSKSARLMKNFTQLGNAYFSMRWTVGSRSGEPDHIPLIGQGYEASASTSTSSKNSMPQDLDRLGIFYDNLCKYARYSQFEVKATLRHGDLLNTEDMVSSLDFDRDEDYFASATCKKIKIFECDAVLNERVDIHYPISEMTNRSKLSSICWNSYIKSHLASSDIAAVVQVWDVQTSQSLLEYKEHKKSTTSVDFSHADPTKLASGGLDCFVKLWSITQAESIATIKANAQVCCVQFSPDKAHLLAFGSADHTVRCYDLRHMMRPLCILEGHKKTVTHIKFMDSGTLVSASLDSTLKLWDINGVVQSGHKGVSCSLTFNSHKNSKSYIGLSASGGYIACGSENNSVFAYHKSFQMPVAMHNFSLESGQESEDDIKEYVSSVCWRAKTQTLLAGSSMGNMKVLELV